MLCGCTYPQLISLSGSCSYPHVPGIFSPEHIKRWKDITAAVKKEGSTFFCQIWHVGRSSHAGQQTVLTPNLPSFALVRFSGQHLSDSGCLVEIHERAQHAFSLSSQPTYSAKGFLFADLLPVFLLHSIAGVYHSWRLQ